MTMFIPVDEWSCKRSRDYWSGISTMSNFDQIWPCCKIGQGQTRVITCINLVPSFKIIEPLVPKKKIVKVLAIYGHGGYLGHVAETILILSLSLFAKEAPYKI